MKEILLFAGTTEGRKLSECLSAAKIPHTVCVATEYGEMALSHSPYANVRQGRMGRQEMESLMGTGRYAAVVDATHPYAREVTATIKAALEGLQESVRDESVLEHSRILERILDHSHRKIPYLRLLRDAGQGQSAEEKKDKEDNKEEGVTYFHTNEACAAALEHTSGNILLAIGSKELASYSARPLLKERLYVRALPSAESILLCEKQGIFGKRVIAMQGPFSVEMNEAVFRQFDISCMVTKDSGANGGFPQKLTAAKNAGVQAFVIGRPQETKGYSFAEVCGKLEGICGKRILPADTEPSGGVQEFFMEISLAGVGMGDRGSLTIEVEQAVREADLLFGAPRLLERMPAGAEKLPYYLAGQIIPYLKESQKENPERIKKAAVLFSGDSGFYSGAKPVYDALEKEIRQGGLRARVRMLPGISSVAYLAARVGESYQDAAVYSLHGKKICNLAKKVRANSKTFLLTSGVADVNRIGEELLLAGLSDCEVVTGYQLSYESQRIETHTPLECRGLREEGLYTCLVKNPSAAGRELTHGLPDSWFIRDKVPMTKEEVREVSICKLKLRDGAVVYDIGSGTGSIAVEIAALSDDIQVYAIERKKEAVSLIEQNRKKAGLSNIQVVAQKALEAFPGLPAPTHALVGGSGGRLKEILTALYNRNPKMRVVINAVSMETVCEIKEILYFAKTSGRIKDAQAVQLQVSRAREAGDYHLVRSENPVWICAFTFCKEE